MSDVAMKASFVLLDLVDYFSLSLFLFLLVDDVYLTLLVLQIINDICYWLAFVVLLLVNNVRQRFWPSCSWRSGS